MRMSVTIDERLIEQHGDKVSSPYYCPFAWWLREHGFASVDFAVDVDHVSLRSELGLPSRIVFFPPEFYQWQLDGIRDRQALRPITFEVDLPEPPNTPVVP